MKRILIGILTCIIVILGVSETLNAITEIPEKQNDLEHAYIVRVVDGDTLVIDRGQGEEKVRLIGIDTPESVHPDESKNTEGGDLASAYTKELLSNNSSVWLQKDTSDTDRYGRLLRYVWLTKPSSIYDEQEIKSSMLNALLIINGYAETKAYEPDTMYSDLFSSL